jgi:hypothetical protein
LRIHLLNLRDDPAYAPLLRETLVETFVAPPIAAYAQLEDMARFAQQAGYPEIR